MALSTNLDWLRARSSSWTATHGYFPLITAAILVYAAVRVIYLLWFHPLSNIPGPKLSAVSNINYARAWLSGRYPWAMEQMFQKYGNVVRVAPNEVIFISPQAYAQIYGSTEQGRPTFIKSDLLDDPSKYPGLFSVKDVDEHRAARRTFQPAFNPRLYAEYAPTIDKFVSVWLDKLEKLSASEGGVDVTHWLEFLMCDIAGVMALGHEYKNMENGHGGPLLQSINSMGWWATIRVALKRFPLLSPLQWLFLNPRSLMVYSKAMATNVQAVSDRIENHYDAKRKRDDYMTPVLTERRQDDLPPKEYLSAHLTNIIYGHVETATIATAGVYFLLMNPDAHRKLTQELRGRFQSFDELTDQALQSIAWLVAVIDETIRLHTNVPYGLPRLSPGTEIDGYNIPKGVIHHKALADLHHATKTVVASSAFATTHSAQYFAKPREFRPERWLPRAHADYDAAFDGDNRAAYRPFSMGSRGCIGQGVAGMLLRAILGRLAWRFDWEMLNKGEVYWERDIRLYSVWRKPPVMVRFHPAPPAAKA